MAVAQQHTREGRIEPALVPIVNIKGLDDDDDGLGALISGHAAQKHEERRNIEVVGEHKLRELIIKYEQYLDNPLKYIKGTTNLINEVLTPKEIDDFLQMTQLFSEHVLYPAYTCFFINTLIKNSYKAGHNNFELNIKNSIRTLECLCNNIHGKRERVIYIIINGNVGAECLRNMVYSYVTINGDMQSMPSYGSKYSSFVFNGECGPDIVFFNSDFCIFKTPNKKMLDRMLNSFRYMRNNRTCEIYFINPNGTEELVRADSQNILN